MPPSLTLDTSEGRDTTNPLLFECAWEVANKGSFLLSFKPLATQSIFASIRPSLQPSVLYGALIDAMSVYAA